MSAENDVKKLSDLRVVDLRTELEKRGLDKSGVKQTLIDRLAKALTDEGLNSETYNFQLDKKPVRLSTSSRETEEGVAEEQNLLGEKMETQAEGKNEDNNNSDVAKEMAEVSDFSEEKKVDEDMESLTTEITQSVDTAKADESPITLTVEEEEFETSEGEKSTAPTIENLSDEKRNDETLGDEPAKEVDNSSTQLEADKSEEIATNGAPSTDNKETSGKPAPTDAQNRNLWITNISQTTRATELKQALSQHGKVIGAKVVINARYPGACCYGYVKMETVADADTCIARLSGTELNGQIIRIEKVRPDHLNPLKNAMKRTESERTSSKAGPKATEKKDVGQEKPRDKKSSEEKDKDDKKVDKSERSSRSETDTPKHKLYDDRERTPLQRLHRSREAVQGPPTSRERGDRSLSNRRVRDTLTFDKIRHEREREKHRERERLLREHTRKRDALERQKEIDRTERLLIRERERLRLDRERLERDRAEFLRFERERQKEERERLEMEKMELHRAKLRIQQEGRRADKRPSSSSYKRDDFDGKRRPIERHPESAPLSSRYESSLKPREPSPKKFASTSSSKDYYKPKLIFEKRDLPPKRDMNYESDRPQSSMGRTSSNVNVFNVESRGRILRDTCMSPTLSDHYPRIPADRPRERVSRESPVFRAREPIRRLSDEQKADIPTSRDRRFGEPCKDSRSFDRGSGNTWRNSPDSPKGGYASPLVRSSNWVWRAQESTSTGERWNSASGSRCGNTMSGSSFSNNSGMGAGPAPCPPPCPPPPGISNYVNDRFDNKNMRKY